MNALNVAALRNPNIIVPRQFIAATSPSRPQRRERDFGIGYGTSSGYASPRRYIADNGPRMFRLA